MNPETVARIKALGLAVPDSVQDMDADELIHEVLSGDLSLQLKHLIIESIRRWINYGETFVKHENLIAAGVIFRD